MWPDIKTLHEATAWGSPHSICVVLWVARDELIDWLRSQAAEDISGRAESYEEPSISDPVVEAALVDLTESVNLGTGLHHPSDRASAIHTFSILKKHGYAIDPSEVYRSAAGHGWDGDGASQLREVAEGVRDGRKFRGATRAWKDTVIYLWREDAAKASDTNATSD